MTTTIQVDGAMGEGGGQVLRSALSLSLLTGQSFRVSRIRANRDRAGLRPQHLAAVQAAARVSRAEVRGDRVGSEEIEFAPGTVRSGDYFFDVGTAGATSLVLQTLLLPLALAPGTSSVTIRGGTHMPWSPCFHYLDWQWRPLLARIGVPFELTMTMAGFYPQGGGELQAPIPGSTRPTPLRLTERGPLRAVRGTWRMICSTCSAPCARIRCVPRLHRRAAASAASCSTNTSCTSQASARAARGPGSASR